MTPNVTPSSDQESMSPTSPIRSPILVLFPKEPSHPILNHTDIHYTTLYEQTPNLGKALYHHVLSPKPFIPRVCHALAKAHRIKAHVRDNCDDMFSDFNSWMTVRTQRTYSRVPDDYLNPYTSSMKIACLELLGSW